MKKNKIALAVIGILLFSFLAYVFINKSKDKTQEGVKVFFCKLIGNQIVTEPVLRKMQNNETSIKFAIKNLLEGPTKEEKEKGFFSEIPVGTRLIDIKEEVDQLRINLNDQFISGGGTESMVSRMNQLKNTALKSEPIRKVYVDIDGKQLEVLGNEGLEITQPLSLNND